MTRWMHLMIASAAAMAVACGSDSTAPLDDLASATKTSGTDSTGGSGGGGNNNTVGLVISPANMTLAVGNVGGFTVAYRDASGKLTTKRATLVSSNSAVLAIIADSGLVQAKSVGSATVTATVDGQTVTAAVTVTTAVTPTPVPPPVSEFAMKVVALGRVPGADTSRADRIAGATVKLLRVGGVAGDTLKTPIDAGNAVTDANGEASFAKLAGGSYEIHVTPPAGSAYKEGFSGFGPPRQSSFTVNVSLLNK